MRNYQNQYVHGSLAYKENKYEELEQRKGKVKSKKVNRELLFYRLNLIVSIFVVFGMVVGLMTQYSNVSFKQNKIKKIEQQIKIEKDNLADAKVAIAETINTKNIQKVATERLGMVKVSDYQVVYINVPKVDYTVKY